jgi:hypothetical protein
MVLLIENNMENNMKKTKYTVTLVDRHGQVRDTEFQVWADAKSEYNWYNSIDRVVDEFDGVHPYDNESVEVYITDNDLDVEVAFKSFIKSALALERKQL